MKILAISHEYPPVGGGGANACLFLLDLFAKKGHDVSLITTAFEDLPRDENTSARVRIHRVDSKRRQKEHCGFGEMLSFLLKSRRYAVHLCKKESFDLAIIFFGIPAGPVGVTLKRKFNLPFIIRFGGGDIPGFQDRFRFVYKLLGPFIKGIWRKADERIANSDGLRELAYDFCRKYPFDIIPNGVDTSIFKPANTQHGSDGIFRILFVSRLIERKGLQHVIPQLPQLRDELESRGIAIRLTIVGDGPYRDVLQQLALKNGVSDVCEFVGQKDKSELPIIYNDADVFILPSDKEGMPNVVLEAMACALPIVMTPCQGSDELIGDNGYVCPVNEFGSKLLELALDGFTRQIKGRVSLDMVQKHFTWENTAAAYLDRMHDIVDLRQKEIEKNMK